MCFLFYLALDKHSHVHEHVMELLDGGLKLDDIGVPRFDVRQGLLGSSCVHDNALDEFKSEVGRGFLALQILFALLKKAFSAYNLTFESNVLLLFRLSSNIAQVIIKFCSGYHQI